MYTVDYFIKKFEAIPEDKHGRGSSQCAYWHCGLFGGDSTMKEAVALSDLFIKYFPNECHCNGATNHLYHDETSWFVVKINDGIKTQYKQPTPKQRILAALYDIKKMQEGDTILGNKSIQYPDATKEILSSIHNPEVETDVVRERVNN